MVARYISAIVVRVKSSSIFLAVLATAFVAFLLVIVTSSLVRPEVETFVPTPPAPEDVGDAVVGPVTYTVDARSHDGWVHFDFSRGSVVDIDARSSLDWDIAFQRHRMLTNGGATNPMGQGGVLDLGPASIDSATIELADDGFVADQRSGDVGRNALLEDWYDYSWTSHILSPTDRTYALRTADGNYAVFRIIGYYCPGGRPGCLTFRYRYRGDGERIFP